MGVLSSTGSAIGTGLSVLAPIADFGYGYSHGGGIFPGIGTAAGSYAGYRGGSALGGAAGSILGLISPKLRGIGKFVGSTGGGILGSMLASQGALALFGKKDKQDDPYGMLGGVDVGPRVQLPPIPVTKSASEKQGSILGRVINNAARNLAVSIASNSRIPLQHAQTMASGLILGGSGLSAVGAATSEPAPPRSALHRAAIYGRALGLF